MSSQKTLKIVPYHLPDASEPRRQAGQKRKRRMTSETPSKVRNACTACREKKTRCSGHQPCIRCKELNRVCRYMSLGDSPEAPVDGPLEVDTRFSDPLPTPATALTNEHIDTESPEQAFQNDQYGHIHGGASEFAFLHYTKQKLASLPSGSIQFSDHPLCKSDNVPPILPPKAIADGIVRNFFDFGLATVRFVHRPSFLADYERLYDTEVSSHLIKETTALIYMVMALGSHYSRREDAFCGYASSVRFYKMAVNQLEEISVSVTMTSLQTRLLEVHYLLNHSRLHEAWASFGIVVRYAQALGLHRASQGPIKNHIWHEYRKRIFWAVYANDRLLSGVFGRPCAIHDDDIDQEECSLANDEGITITTCELTKPGALCLAAALVHYSRLVRILGAVLKRLYGPSARQSSMLRLHQLATNFEEQLSQWQNALPAYLDYVRLPPSAMSVLTQRQTCTLKLTFAHVCLLLYRPFIIYTISNSTATSLSLGDWVKNCHEKSIEAAETVVAECRFLYEHGLFTRAFWLVNYVQFAAIGTLYIYSRLWPESDHIHAMAERAMEEYPAGVEGDMVGQEYFKALQQIREITSNSTEAIADTSARPAQSAALDEFQFDLNGAWANLFFDTNTMDEQPLGIF